MRLNFHTYVNQPVDDFSASTRAYQVILHPPFFRFVALTFVKWLYSPEELRLLKAIGYPVIRYQLNLVWVGKLYDYHCRTLWETGE